jgi:Uncharacterised protein family (UPF0236)
VKQKIASRRALRKALGCEFEKLSSWIVEKVVDEGCERPDELLRERAGEALRAALGKALSARAEKIGVESDCSCGKPLRFRQRCPFTLHTVLPGRDAKVRIPYGRCESCGRWSAPLLEELGCDAEGFMPALRDLGLLAAVVEPYDSASESLLPRFAGVKVSKEKLQALVHENGEKADAFVKRPLERLPSIAKTSMDQKQVYVGIDGGMAHVDGVWQEVKLGCVFKAENRIVKGKARGVLVDREYVAARGEPFELRKRLAPCAKRAEADERMVNVLGDGARWIWNLAAEMFHERREILDWYHVEEHVGLAAKVLHGETADADSWRDEQLALLWDGKVDDVIESLEIYLDRARPSAARTGAADLMRYFENNRHRMDYKTWRAQGLFIGSGAVESAVKHVVQHRMKQSGMRWRSPGADAMLSLRAIYRSTNAWDRFLAHKAA